MTIIKTKRILLSLLSLILIATYFSPVLAQDATSEGDSVLEKVKQKVETLKKNPKASIGTITDKTDTSIQIKGLQGKIELVSVTDTTYYTKVDKTETDIKFTDIAIGDYVLALGTFGSSQVLNARRIILTNPPVSRKIIIGEVSSIVRKEITIDTLSESNTFVFPSNWKGPEIKEISEGDTVVVVTVENEGKQNIRTIDVISSEPEN